LILEIPRSAEPQEIKKAFRKLSLVWHPDKNRNNPLPAAAKFHQITKAYDALTDELARSNWEKYGNPDGAGPMHVAIGLPKFLLDSANAVPALIISFIFIIVIIPYFFFYFYSSSTKQDEHKRVEESH
jgi:translocation protein SEC63